jgi:hypothetical protein
MNLTFVDENNNIIRSRATQGNKVRPSKFASFLGKTILSSVLQGDSTAKKH